MSTWFIIWIDAKLRKFLIHTNIYHPHYTLATIKFQLKAGAAVTQRQRRRHSRLTVVTQAASEFPAQTITRSHDNAMAGL